MSEENQIDTATFTVFCETEDEFCAVEKFVESSKSLPPCRFIVPYYSAERDEDCMMIECDFFEKGTLQDNVEYLIEKNLKYSEKV
jgi:hypothetical protein